MKNKITKLNIIIIIISLILSILLIRGSSNQLTGNSISPPIETGDPIQLFICPNCTNIYLNFINSQNNLKCAFFDLSHKKIKKSLEGKSEILTDKTVKSKGYMHNKFCVGKNIIITGSANPTHNGLELNRNNILIIPSKYLAKNYEDEFNEIKTKKETKTKYTTIIYNNKTIENYFCPEDKCADKIIKQITNAKKSIYFATFSFTHKGIANSLIEAHNKGIIINGIMEKQQNSKYSRYKTLKKQGINVSWDAHKGKFHHKVFIIDEKILIIGSMNPTKSGNERNDENILIIHNEKFAEQFINKVFRSI